jgi:hypothetical protein
MIEIGDVAKQWLKDEFVPGPHLDSLTQEQRDAFYRDLGLLSDFLRSLPGMLKARGITQAFGVPVEWSPSPELKRTTEMLDGSLALLHEHGIRCDAKDLEAARLRQSMGVSETQKPKA